VRTSLLRLAALLLSLSVLGAQAQGWPERPVRIINPFSPGAASDVAARLLADKLGQKLGKPFVVENRLGANAIIGTDAVAKAEPDGYTLLAGGNTTHAANPALYKSLPYDPVRDFAPAAFVAGLHYYLVVAPSAPARSVRDLIAHARANPRKTTYGTGNASSTVAAELLKLGTGTDFEQVNYKGNPLAAADVMSGALSMMFLDTSTARPLLQAGRLRALGIAAERRSELFPDVPTLGEAGLAGLSFTSWIGLWFPAGTPRAIVERLAIEAHAARLLPDVVPRLRDLGFSLDGPGQRPEEFGAFVRSEIALWARVVRDAKIPQQP
jgi:tripartite-type tricarboxylate transporter receptor subunit TctC